MMPSDRLPATFPSFGHPEDDRKQCLAAALRLVGHLDSMKAQPVTSPLGIPNFCITSGSTRSA